MRLVDGLIFVFFISIIFNFYFWKLYLNSYNVEECLNIREEYKQVLESKSIKRKKAEFVEVKYTEYPATIAISKTAEVKSYDDKLQFINSQIKLKSDNFLNSSIIESNEFLKHCITGDVICRVPKNIELSPIKSRKIANINKEKSNDRRNSFKKIHDDRKWGHNFDNNYTGISASGEGSTLNWSQEMVAVLHNTINKIKSSKSNNYKIRILDVPCGDMAWMQRFLESRNDINYTGIDIVPDLISHHKIKFKDKNWKFYVQDIVEVEDLGFYDVIICRMLFQHLFSTDVLRILKLFSNSGSDYLITTTFPTKDYNKELDLEDDEDPGRFRMINLELPPYYLIPPTCISRDGPVITTQLNIHHVAVWKLPLMSVKNCQQNAIFLDIDNEKILYNSCSQTSLL